MCGAGTVQFDGAVRLGRWLRENMFVSVFTVKIVGAVSINVF
jgi:hypothetical protein